MCDVQRVIALNPFPVGELVTNTLLVPFPVTDERTCLHTFEHTKGEPSGTFVPSVKGKTSWFLFLRALEDYPKVSTAFTDITSLVKTRVLMI